MLVLCVIPARYASTRLPGKPLVDLCGKTLIQRVVEAVNSADCFDDIIVATDDERIYEHVSSLGVKVEMTDSQHRSGTERVVEVARRHPEYDYVVNVQGDEPEIELDLLRDVVDELRSGNHKGIVTAVTPIEISEANDPNKVKVVLNYEGFALLFSRSIIPMVRNLNPKMIHYRHIGIYGFYNKTLNELAVLPETIIETVESLEQLRWLYYGHQIKCLKGNWQGKGIDSPEDVQSFIQKYKTS